MIIGSLNGVRHSGHPSPVFVGEPEKIDLVTDPRRFQEAMEECVLDTRTFGQKVRAGQYLIEPSQIQRWRGTHPDYWGAEHAILLRFLRRLRRNICI